MARIYGEIASSALMTFDKSFSRSNGQPLDSTEVYYSLAAAEAYALTDVAYVGQKLVVIETVDDVTTVTHYGVEADGTLKALGSVPVGDGMTVEVVDGKIQLAALEGHTSGTYQPYLVDGKIEWREPSATTVEGLDGRLTTSEGDIDDLEGIVGNAEAGLVKDVADNEAAIEAVDAKIGEVAEGKTIVGMIAEAQEAATYDDTQVKADIQTNADAIAAIEADYLKAADKYDDTALAGRVKAIEDDHLVASDKTELEGKITAAEESAVDRVLGYLAEEVVNEKFDTLKEIATWIESDTTASAQLVTRITDIEKDYLKGTDKTELQGKIDDLAEYVGTLPEGAAAETIVAYIQEVVDALNIGDYAKAADLTALEGNINTALEGKVDVADGYRLMSDTEGAKLEGIEAGAQANKIETVGAEFDLTDKNLTIAAIEQSKVTGLSDALAAKVDVVEGSRLMTNDEGTKLAGIAEGAEANFIKSVDEAQFAVNAGNLTLLDIAMGKVTGLSDALAGKVDKVDGYRMISTDEATKLGKLVLAEDGSVEVSGEISASNVKELDTWITTNRDTVLGLLSVEQANKLAGIAANAQENVLEGVKVGGTLLDIVSKTIEIPVATAAALGVVKSSDAENKIAVAADGTMEVNQIGVSKLVNDGTDLILNGGAATI